MLHYDKMLHSLGLYCLPTCKYLFRGFGVSGLKRVKFLLESAFHYKSDLSGCKTFVQSSNIFVQKAILFDFNIQRKVRQ